MKTSFFLLLSALSFIIYSCTNPTKDSDLLLENRDTEEIQDDLKFNGEDKGDYLLYGHVDMNIDGTEKTVEEMVAILSENGSFKGKVTVIIAEVCQKAGCWITFENSEDESIRVFFRDHFTIPTNTLIGTEAILYGTTIRDTLSIDFQKHLLDDAKEAGEKVAQAEYDKITEDLIEITFDCEAVLVRKL